MSTALKSLFVLIQFLILIVFCDISIYSGV
uniref:Uncharacterized protein n=1 Tax=Anguilla anguilla TaxID=7936 RepID=A0A0E9W115_ANGAN